MRTNNVKLSVSSSVVSSVLIRFGTTYHILFFAAAVAVAADADDDGELIL